MARAARFLFSAALLGLLASANAALTCNDLVVPSLGNDATPGLIPAGPKLLSTTTSGGAYDYVINSATDALEFFVESEPGVGVGQDFTRKLDIALSGTNVTTYTAATTGFPAGCKIEYGFFELDSGLTGVTVSNTSGVTTTSISGVQDRCIFQHKYSVAWETFRSSLSNCGFTVSTVTDSPANGRYRKYAGRIHVKWEDYATTGTSRVRPAMDTWYDVTIQIQDEATQVTTPVTNEEIPYESDFTVNGITYTKDTNGKVVATIAYSLSTNFPYYATIPSGDAHDFLFHGATTGATATYAGNVLGYTGSADYTDGAWANTFVSGQNGRVTDTSSAACDAPGETCLMSGELTYSWTPTPSNPKSCSISSNSNYQFDFMLGCVDYNGTNNDACGTTKLRDALAIPLFGAFRFSGNVDFCKSAATDFPITWGPAFDVVDTARDIGQTIEAVGAFTTNKKLSAVSIKEFRVARSDLSGYWSLWTAAADTAVATGSAGGRSTDIGVNTNFLGTTSSSNEGKTWSISTSFTPNIKLYDSVQLTFDSVGSRGAYMISLPNDKSLTLSFTATLIIRMYSDATQNFAGARRRLMYRDTPVPVFRSATAVSDSEYSTSPASVKIPSNVQVSGDGSVTVLNTQPALSTGAIAGIAAIGAVVGGALVAMTILLVRRQQKKNAARAEGADFAAIVQAPSGDFDAKQYSKVAPAGSRDFLMEDKTGFKPIVPQWTSPSTGGSNTSGRIVA